MLIVGILIVVLPIVGYTECHYAQFQDAKGHYHYHNNIMLSVANISVNMLSVGMLNSLNLVSLCQVFLY